MQLKRQRMLVILRFLVLAAGVAVTMADQNCSCGNGSLGSSCSGLANGCLEIVAHTPADGTQGVSYTDYVGAAGGTTPYSWSIVGSGNFPPGLTTQADSTTRNLNITGTPSTQGTYTFTVQVKDSSSPQQSASQPFTIVIAGNNPQPLITSLSPPSVVAGSGPLTLTINGSNFVGNPNGSTVNFGVDTGLVPSAVTSSSLTVTIPATALTTPGSIPVTVTNPPGGANYTSPPATFTVTSPTKTYGNGVIVGPGNSPALSDNGMTLVDGYNTGVNGGAASADVYTNTSGTWSRAAVLQSTTGIASVAISGDGNTVVIGDCAGNACVGNVYVYDASTVGGWASAPNPMPPTATLTASNAAVSTRFGYSVATDKSGDTIGVGAPCDYTAGITLCGTVYVYLKKTGWATRHEDAQLQIATTGAGNATLGLSVAMDSAGQTIVAGLPGVNGNGPTTPGAAYVFVQPGCPGACTGWITTDTATANLTPSQASNPANGDNFGWAIAISGDGATVIAGAPNHAGAGAAYEYVNSTAPAGWKSATETNLLTANNGQSGDHFGNSIGIALTGATIVIGAPHPFSSSATPGATYVFDSGAQHQQLAAFAGNDIFGNAITPQDDFGGGNPFGDGPGVALSSDGSTLAIGGLAMIGTTSNQQEVWIFP
ncbi:MAG TPA: IPT/TIG domain-containing protein [Candidatus Dormibacteraeota bacterium]|nr:IPT/TIG domain-containing protein [Candidatus Dormibacteraeota bacterium]